jgi:hypothetical protein
VSPELIVASIRLFSSHTDGFAQRKANGAHAHDFHSNKS